MGSVIPALDLKAHSDSTVQGDIRHAGPDGLRAALLSGREQLTALF